MYTKSYFVYILTNSRNTVLYIGVTSDLIKRVFEHKNKLIEGFSKEYNLEKLIYYEMAENIHSAIEYEKRLKAWKREWKENLINKMNPDWKDLYFEIAPTGFLPSQE